MRASNLAVSPSREICPDAGLTHQSPMRSVVEVGRSMRDRGGWPLQWNREATVADYTSLRRSADLLLRDATSTPVSPRPLLATTLHPEFRSIQGVSGQSSGLPGFHLRIVQLA